MRSLREALSGRVQSIIAKRARTHEDDRHLVCALCGTTRRALRQLLNDDAR